MHMFGPLLEADRRRFDGGSHPIRSQAMEPGRGEAIAERSQMIEQCKLQHARPRPQFAHRQRRDRLERADEALQALAVETAGAGSNQFQGECVDARIAPEFVGSDAGKPFEERRRQIVMNVARGLRDDVEVVEQPLGGRRGWFLPRVFSQRGIDLAKRAHVILDLTQMRASTAALRLDGQQRRQPPRVLLEQFDAEQFLAVSQPAWSWVGPRHRPTLSPSSAICLDRLSFAVRSTEVPPPNLCVARAEAFRLCRSVVIAKRTLGRST
jgi:hypothetical protein